MHQKLYVGNLPWRTTEEEFRKLFQDFEPIHSILLIINPETQLTRGYGFVELDADKAEAAIKTLGKSMFMGRELRVCKAEGREQRERKRHPPDYCMRESYIKCGDNGEFFMWECWSRGCGVCVFYRGRCGDTQDKY